MTLEELEAASSAEDPLLVAFVKGREPGMHIHRPSYQALACAVSTCSCAECTLDVSAIRASSVYQNMQQLEQCGD